DADRATRDARMTLVAAERGDRVLARWSVIDAKRPRRVDRRGGHAVLRIVEAHLGRLIVAVAGAPPLHGAAGGRPDHQTGLRPLVRTCDEPGPGLRRGLDDEGVSPGGDERRE